MSLKNLTTSFVGGEITPELFGRLDLPNFQAGLATCRNCIVLPHGPVTARPGFEYVLEVKDSTKKTRVINFAFNTQQTYAIEIGDQYMRFHTAGATLLETSQNLTSLTQANPGVFGLVAHGYAIGDWLYLNDIVGPTELNARFFIVASTTTNTFTLTDLADASIDTSSMTAYVSGGTRQGCTRLLHPTWQRISSTCTSCSLPML